MADRPDPAAVVADSGVLAADLLVGGASREVMDLVRSHSWIDLVASDALLDDAQAVIAELASPAIASDWREQVDAERVPVEHPEGDHPGLSSAHRAGAAQLVTLDDSLTSADAGVGLQGRVQVSVRTPEAFLRVFDPERLYAAVADGEYPGPDKDPRG